mgnify:CR=1 FL=1
MRTRRCIKHAVLGPDRVTSVAFHPERMMVAAACGRDLFFWDVDGRDARPRKMLETTIGFLCLYFHPNGRWLLTCEVRSLGSGGSGPTAAVHSTPHFCIRLRDLDANLSPFSGGNDATGVTSGDADILPMVLVYSESGTCISPCGRFLAVCLPAIAAGAATVPAPQPQTQPPGVSLSSGSGPPSNSASQPAVPAPNPSADAMQVDDDAPAPSHPQPRDAQALPPEYKNGYIAVVSLCSPHFAQVLCSAPIPRASKITCIRFSASCDYLLVGYGVRPNAFCPRPNFLH